MSVTTASPPAVTVRRALPFSEPVGFRPLELDLYVPDGAPPPVVVYLHGGGWQRGSRRQPGPAFSQECPPLLERVAAAGFAVASVDYRLSGEATFPCQLDDVRAALAWLAAEAGTLGIDASRTVVWGDSAGGHLAALASLAERADDAPGVVGTVLWYAPTDLVNLQADADAMGGESHAGPDSREGRLLGVALEDAGDAARRASPVAYVASGAAPFLLVHGTADRAVPAAQSIRMTEVLRAAGNQATLEMVDGADHMWRGASTTDLARIVGLTIDFASATTAPTPPSARWGPVTS